MRGGVETIEGIPVRWVAPDAPQGVALWLTHLGGRHSATMIRARPNACGSSSTTASNTSRPQATSGCTQPRSSGWCQVRPTGPTESDTSGSAMLREPTMR
jgi:hypothetical protein